MRMAATLARDGRSPLIRHRRRRGGNRVFSQKLLDGLMKSRLGPNAILHFVDAGKDFRQKVQPVLSRVLKDELQPPGQFSLKLVETDFPVGVGGEQSLKLGDNFNHALPP